ncbi:MAG: hypothetical protein JSV24_08330 [Bacteroidales bacterium]|nr:MAG: hypothetical protein JSV24_08330 [Bacteroidales bacterium]
MKRTNSAVLAGLLITSFLTGCAVSRKLSYNTIKTDIAANPGLTYSIASYDQ